MQYNSTIWHFFQKTLYILKSPNTIIAQYDRMTVTDPSYKLMKAFHVLMTVCHLVRLPDDFTNKSD